MSPRSGWLLVNEILPRLRSAVPQVAHCVGAKDSEELIGDATLHAARILHSAEARNKTVSASSVAYYAIEHTRPGAAGGAVEIAPQMFTVRLLSSKAGAGSNQWSRSSPAMKNAAVRSGSCTTFWEATKKIQERRPPAKWIGKR